MMSFKTHGIWLFAHGPLANDGQLADFGQTLTVWQFMVKQQTKCSSKQTLDQLRRQQQTSHSHASCKWLWLKKPGITKMEP